jgi:hypothetical protein
MNVMGVDALYGFVERASPESTTATLVFRGEVLLCAADLAAVTASSATSPLQAIHPSIGSTHPGRTRSVLQSLAAQRRFHMLLLALF